jgi:hypothetical protein
MRTTNWRADLNTMSRVFGINSGTGTGNCYRRLKSIGASKQPNHPFRQTRTTTVLPLNNNLAAGVQSPAQLRPSLHRMPSSYLPSASAFLSASVQAVVRKDHSLGLP